MEPISEKSRRRLKHTVIEMKTELGRIPDSLHALEVVQRETDAVFCVGVASNFVHGSTIIINALTERKGVRTGLITTKGFRDVLAITRANRPAIYNLYYTKPEPFVPRFLRLEVRERVNYKGEDLEPLNEHDVRQAAAFFQGEGVEAIAVCFLHAYTFHLDASLELVNFHLTALGRVDKPRIPRLDKDPVRSVERAFKGKRQIVFDQGYVPTPTYERGLLPVGATLSGPLIVEEPAATTVVLAGQRMSVDPYGYLHIEEE